MSSSIHVDFIQFVDVLRTSVSNKTDRILAQVGNVLGRTVESFNVEWLQHVGFVSRPTNPVPGKSAARGLSLKKGGHDVIFASEDDRGVALKANLGAGETCVYAAGADGKSQGRVIIKDDGSINVYTTHDNTDAGRSVYFRVAPDEFVFNAPWGTIKFDATGFHVVHGSGATINMGGMSGLGAPFDLLSSYARIQADAVSQVASIQTNGAGGGAALASAYGVMAAITLLQNQITTLTAAIAAAAQIPGTLGPQSQFAQAILAAAGTVAGFATALGPATERIPTSTTSV